MENTEPSMSDLRSMAFPAAETKEAPAAEAPAKEAESKTEPDSGTDAVAVEKVAAAETKDQGEPEVPAGVQKRIDKAVRAQREAERKVAELEARLSGTGSQPAKETAQPAAPAGKPDSKNFETYEAYVEALADWRVDVREAERAQKNAAKLAAETWNARQAAVKAKHSDYDEVLQGAEKLPISRTMHEAITDSDNEHGPMLAYHFASNPDETERIAALGPAAARREIAKIELTFVAPPDAPAKTAARALPKPPAKVGGSAAPSAFDFDKADMSSFKREMQKQMRK